MLQALLQSLRHRHYRVYFLAQLISVSGTWMQNTAQAWLVYRLTHSSLLLGLTSFAGLVPVLLFGLVGGLMADRLPRRNLLAAAQALAFVQALVLGLLVASGHIQVWEIIALAFGLGILHAIEMPTRHAFIAELVPHHELANAIALNSSVFTVARFIGPAIAGAMVARLGEAPVFFTNAATFAVVLAALFTIPVRGVAPAGGTTGRRRALAEGLAYAWAHRRIRAALMLIAVTSLAGTGYSVLLPIFSKEVFGGNAETLGIMLGSVGAGAMIAALRLAWLGGRQRLESNIAVAALVAGGAMLAFSSVGTLAPALLLLVLLGFTLTTMVATVNTLVQVLVEDRLRGRVMSLFSVLFIGLTSVGNLCAGALALRIGTPSTVMVFGINCLLSGGVFGLYYALARRKESVGA